MICDLHGYFMYTNVFLYVGVFLYIECALNRKSCGNENAADKGKQKRLWLTKIKGRLIDGEKVWRK